MNPILIRLFMVPLACIFFGSSSLSFAADRATIEAAKKEGKIVIYIVYPRSFLPQIKEDFRKTFQLGGDFNIDFIRKGSPAVVQMVEAEHMTGNMKWDVVCTSIESAFLRWIEKDMLLKFQPPNIENIRKEFRDELGYTVSAHVYPTTFGINKKRIAKENRPKSFKDFLDPKWKGRISYPDPATAGPGILSTWQIMKLYGWDYFRKLGKNKPLLVKGASALFFHPNIGANVGI